MTRLPVRAMSMLLVSAMVVTLPGPAAYAAGAEAAMQTGARPVSAPVALPFLGMPSAAGAAASPLNLGRLGSSLTTLGAPVLPGAAVVSAAAAQNADTGAGPVAAATEARVVPVAATALPAGRVTLSAASAVSESRREIAAALELAGPMASAPVGSAHELGARVQNLLSGETASERSALGVVSAAGPSDEVPGRRLARPAGDLIRQAAESNDDGANTPVPPANGGGSKIQPEGPNGPFWPKLLASGLALLPAILLGGPLLAANAYLIGSLFVASSITLAVMPFLGESAPKILRAAPGITLAAAGVASLGIAISLTMGLGVAAATGMAWSGGLAIIGGWGLTRYGVKNQRRNNLESVEALSAYFGGVAALTGIGIAALGSAGLFAQGVLWVTYPASLLLWLQLPSWVGMGMTSAVHGLWLSIKAGWRAGSAVREDTKLFDRLSAFSERHWETSKWNGVWLAFVWTPLALIEAAFTALGTALGAAAGLVQAPLMFAWGATAKLWPGSKANVYAAESARLSYDLVTDAKNKFFNPLSAKLSGYADATSLGKSALGSLGVRLLQLGWAVYTAVAVPALTLAGPFVGAFRVRAYDEKRHDAEDLRLTKDNAGDREPAPEEPKPEPGAPTGSTLVPKLIAAALALAPIAYFAPALFPALTMLTILQGGLFLAAALPLAAMPFMGRAPRGLKMLAGQALTWNGMALLISGHAPIMGAVALLAGWGFKRWVAKISKEKGYSFDESELGAFFGALGAVVGIGAAWVSVGGTLGSVLLGAAVLLSPFLLIHLPLWVWIGFVNAFTGLWRAMKDFTGGLSNWWESDYRQNLSKHASYWLGKTYWNGVWLSMIWAPLGLLAAATTVVGLALGVVQGVLRAPMAYLTGALQEAKPEAKLTKYLGRLMKHWARAAEGSTGLRDAMIKPFAASQKSLSFGATLAFIGEIVARLLWAAIAVLASITPVAFVIGAVKALKTPTDPNESR